MLQLYRCRGKYKTYNCPSDMSMEKYSTYKECPCQCTLVARIREMLTDMDALHAEGAGRRIG